MADRAVAFHYAAAMAHARLPMFEGRLVWAVPRGSIPVAFASLGLGPFVSNATPAAGGALCPLVPKPRAAPGSAAVRSPPAPEAGPARRAPDAARQER